MIKSFLLIVALVFISAPGLHAESVPKGIISLDGRDALPIKLNDMDGNAFELSALKGHWVFVHFWASWCGPCRREMPTIQSIMNEYAETKLKFAIINTAESEDAVFRFLGGVAPDIVPLMDTDGVVTEQWQPRGLPSTFFVDPKGKLRYLALGGRDWEKKDFKLFLNQFK